MELQEGLGLSWGVSHLEGTLQRRVEVGWLMRVDVLENPSASAKGQGLSEG